MGDVVAGDEFDPGVDRMLEAIFSGGEDKEVDSPLGAEVNYDWKHPHWSLSRDGLKKILQVVLSFPSKSTIFTTIWRDADVIRFRADNRDAFLDASLPLQNADTAWDTKMVFLVDSVKLLAFLNSYTQFVLSFDENRTIFYESPYVRYQLDVVNAPPSVFPGLPSSAVDWIKFPISSYELGVFKSLYNFAVKLSDSRILIDSKKTEAFYTLYKFSVLNGSSVKENVILRRLDLPSLKEIIDNNTVFAYTKDRLFFKFDLGYVSFLRVPYDEEAFMYPETFLTGKFLGEFDLDIPLVKRALKLSSLFNVTELIFTLDNNDVYMVVSDRAKFKVGSCSDSATSLTSDFNVGVEIFSNFLSVVSGSTLHVAVSEHGIDLRCDDKEVFSMVRSSMSQIKQGHIPPVLSTPSQGTGQVDFQDSEVV